MGSLTIATDIGGVFREVATFPSGTANDGGITGVTINGVNAVRNKRGIHKAEEVGIYADGADYSTRLQAVMNHSKVKGLQIHVDGGGSIVLNGSITVPSGKYLEFVEGTTLGGSGSITGFKIKAEDNTQCVTTGSALNFTPTRFSRGIVCPAWWGFQPNTGTDMSAPLQKAVTVACENSFAKMVYIAIAGTYIVKNIIVMKNIGSSNPGQTSCSIAGPAQSSAEGVTFKTTDVNAGCLHFQTVLGCNIERITFDGPIPTYVSNPITYNWATGMRDNPVTPSACATIDSLWTGSGSLINSGNKYPGVRADAYNTTQYGGSTNIKFIDCNFYNWYVGVASNLSNCPNGEGLRITGGNSHNVGYFWVGGSLQTREAVIDNHYFFNGRAFLSNLGWGSGLADLPTVINCNINAIKYLFLNGSGDFSFMRFSHIYGESVYSLGFSASQTSVTMFQSQITQLSPDQFGSYTPVSPIWVQTGGPFLWQGGKLEMVGDYSAPIPINCKTAAFRDMFIRGGHLFQTDSKFTDNFRLDNVSYSINGAGGQLCTDSMLNDVQVQAGADAAYYTGRPFFPGNIIFGRDHRKIIGKGPKVERLYAGQYAVTVNPANGTCTFTPDNNGRFTSGDTVVIDEVLGLSATGYSDTATTLGYVTGLTGGAVTCSFTPQGVVNGTYSIYVLRYPKFFGRGFGSITSGSANITNVIADTSGIYNYGARFKGEGIPEGSYVQNWDATNKILTMSMPCTATKPSKELCDAEYRIEADNRPFLFFGGTVGVLDLGVFWFVGDEVMNVFAPPNPALHYRSLYCLVGGKMGDVTHTPYFFTEKPSMDAALLGSSHNILLNNLWYDGVTWRYKATDTSASAFQFINGDLNFYSVTGGTAGATATLVGMIKFSVTAAGVLTVPGSINGITESLSENSVKMASTAWVRTHCFNNYAHFVGGYQVIQAQTQINALVVQQLKGNGPAPTVTTGVGAGTGASATIPLGHSFSFKLSVTAGTSPGAAQTVVATVTLAEAVGGDNPMVVWAARNANATVPGFYFETNSHQEVVVKANAVLTAGLSYDMTITVIDY